MSERTDENAPNEGKTMIERTKEDLQGQKDAPGNENDAELRRRGERRGAGHDTPSGPDTDRTVIPAKREQEQRGDTDIQESKGNLSKET